MLVAATEECFKGYAGEGWVDFQKIHEIPGSTKYQLSQDKLGNLGKLTIRKLGDDLFAIYSPGLPGY